MSNTNQTKHTVPSQRGDQKRPNETGSINVQAFLRIFDPNSKKTIVEKRG